MADILQTTFSQAFSWRNILCFYLNIPHTTLLVIYMVTLQVFWRNLWCNIKSWMHNIIRWHAITWTSVLPLSLLCSMQHCCLCYHHNDFYRYDYWYYRFIIGYEGTDCETNTNECADITCVDGTCIDAVNFAYCYCDTRQIAGFYCQKRKLVIYQKGSSALCFYKVNIDGLVQDCSTSIANALVLPQSYIKPSICNFIFHKFPWTCTKQILYTCSYHPLQRRHNERDGVSNHRRLDCLLNCLFVRRKSKKTSKLRVTVLCESTGDQKGPVTKIFHLMTSSCQ